MGIFRFPRWLFKCLHREEPSRPGRALLGRSWSPLSQLGARPCAEGASSTSMCGERKENLEEENKNTKNDKQGPYKDNSSKHYTTTEARASASAGRASPVSVIPVGEACCLDPASIASAVAGSVQREINLDLKAISGEEGVGRQPSGQRSALFLASPQATKAALDPASVSDIQVGQASNRQHSPPGTSSPSLNPTPIAVAQAYSFFAPPPPPSSSQLQSQPQAPAPTTMAESEARSLISQLDNAVKTIKAIRAKNPDSSISDETRKQTGTLLSRAKHALLQLDALIPTPSVPTTSLALARETLELSALLCILMQEPKAFTRCVTQLQPFYELPASRLPPGESRRSQVMGLYLLLFLSQGDYAGFHTLLEGLEVAARGAAVMEVEAGKDDGGDANMRGTGDEREARVKDNPLEDDEFIQYPIRLEQALMEGSYDRVWGETKDERVPSEEYKVFSKVLVGTIRSEIASCSERAYASLPITNAKNLLFLDSEGAVVQFANERGWLVRDGRIYFPQDQAGDDGSDIAALGGTGGGDVNGVAGAVGGSGFLSEKDGILAASKQVIDNTISYARELETIV